MKQDAQTTDTDYWIVVHASDGGLIDYVLLERGEIYDFKTPKVMNSQKLMETVQELFGI